MATALVKYFADMNDLASFTSIAKRRRIFKVETVGDCYVAAAGLPEARKDHAVTIARFARECMIKMFSLTQKLEMTLGPDTGKYIVVRTFSSSHLQILISRSLLMVQLT